LEHGLESLKTPAKLELVLLAIVDVELQRLPHGTSTNSVEAV